jgi:hypothetical protein
MRLTVEQWGQTEWVDSLIGCAPSMAPTVFGPDRPGFKRSKAEKRACDHEFVISTSGNLAPRGTYWLQEPPRLR